MLYRNSKKENRKSKEENPATLRHNAHRNFLSRSVNKVPPLSFLPGSFQGIENFYPIISSKYIIK